MFPFRGTERRASQMLHGASVFPLPAEGDRGPATFREVLPRPVSLAGHVSTSPSSAGSRPSHGARRDPAGSISFLVNPSRIGDKSHRQRTGTTRCATD